MTALKEIDPPPWTMYAACAFIRRLCREGYIRNERLDELLDRTQNMESGRGFVTDGERRDRKLEEELFS